MVFTSSGGGEINLDISAEDNASGSIDEIAGSLSGMQGAAAAAGGALAAIGIGGMAAATGAAVDFEEAMVEVEKVTSEAVAEGLEDDIRGVAESTRLAHGEVAELSAQAARFGAEGEEEIASFTETAAKMGAATTLSADEAGKSLAKMSTALGSPLGDVQTLADATNKLSNNFAANSEEIVDSATRSGQSLQALGLREDQILGLSAAMNEVSPSSSKAATMMRKLSSAMLDPKNVATFSEAIGVTEEKFVEMREQNPQETIRRLGEAMESGGESSQMLTAQLTNRQVRAFRRVGSQAEKLSETQQTANEAMEEGGSLAKENAADISTFAGQMDILQSKVTTAAQKIGEQLIPIILDLMDEVMPAIDAFIELNDETDGMAGVAALAATAIGGLTAAFAALAPLLSGSVVPALSAVATVLTGPVGLAIAGAVAAVGGLWIAWDKNIGNIQGKVDKFISSIKSSFSVLSDELTGLKNAVKKAFTLSGEQTEQLQGVIEDMSAAVGLALEGIADTVNWLVTNHFQPMMKRIEKLTKKHLAPTVDEFIETFNVVVKRLKTFTGIFIDLWNKYGDKIISVIKPILKTLRVIVAGAFDLIFTTIRTTLALIRGDWKDAWNIIKNFVDRQLGRIEEIFNAFKKTFTNAFDLLITVLDDAWTALWNGIKSTVSGIFTGIVNYIENTAKSEIKTALGAVITTVKNAVDYLTGTGNGTLIGGVKSTLNNIGSWIKNTADSLITSSFNTISSSVEDAIDYLTGTGDGTLIGEVKSTLRGVNTWLVSNAKALLKSAFSVIVSTAEDGVDFLVGTGNGTLIGGVKSVIGDMEAWLTNTAPSKISGAIDSIMSGVEGAFNFLTGSGEDSLIGKVKATIGDLKSWLTGAFDGYNFSKIVNDAVGLPWNVKIPQVTVAGQTFGGGSMTVPGFNTGKDGSVQGVSKPPEDFAYKIELTEEGEPKIIPESELPDAPDPNGGDGGGGGGGGGLIEDIVGGATAPTSTAMDIVSGLTPLATGGVVTDPTAAMVGEGGQSEAVIPLDQLSQMIDTTFQSGVNASRSQQMEMTIRVEGDDELARIIRENAEVVVSQNDQNKENRLRRL